MRTTMDVELTYLGRKIDTAPSSFGELRSSNDVLQDRNALVHRMDEDGYLFLRGVLERDEVLAAREEVLKRLDAPASSIEAIPSWTPSRPGMCRTGSCTSLPRTTSRLKR